MYIEERVAGRTCSLILRGQMKVPVEGATNVDGDWSTQWQTAEYNAPIMVLGVTYMSNVLMRTSNDTITANTSSRGNNAPSSNAYSAKRLHVSTGLASRLALASSEQNGRVKRYVTTRMLSSTIVKHACHTHCTDASRSTTTTATTTNARRIASNLPENVEPATKRAEAEAEKIDTHIPLGVDVPLGVRALRADDDVREELTKLDEHLQRVVNTLADGFVHRKERVFVVGLVRWGLSPGRRAALQSQQRRKALLDREPVVLAFVSHRREESNQEDLANDDVEGNNRNSQQDNLVFGHQPLNQKDNEVYAHAHYLCARAQELRKELAQRIVREAHVDFTASGRPIVRSHLPFVLGQGRVDEEHGEEHCDAAVGEARRRETGLGIINVVDVVIGESDKLGGERNLRYKHHNRNGQAEAKAASASPARVVRTVTAPITSVIMLPTPVVFILVASRKFILELCGTEVRSGRSEGYTMSRDHQRGI
eukprot:scaffold67303_cov66-Phaeocystis_antarctica.AAC.1